MVVGRHLGRLGTLGLSGHLGESGEITTGLDLICDGVAHCSLCCSGAGHSDTEVASRHVVGGAKGFAIVVRVGFDGGGGGDRIGRMFGMEGVGEVFSAVFGGCF